MSGTGEETVRAAPATDDPTGSRNLRLLVTLRWIAVGGQIASIGAVVLLFDVDLPWQPMAAVVAGLVLLNLLSLWRLRFRRPVAQAELLGALLIDVAALTFLLYLSGGASNPFAFLYLLQVALGAVMIDRRATLVLLAATVAAFVGLTIFNVPLPLLERPVSSAVTFQTIGLVICFAINASLLVVFVTQVAGNIRDRDARLAALRQRAAEEDHIVRMGLLASGAAHELGTPLSTVSIILSDWKRMPAVKAEPSLIADVETIEAELKRCKDIVSGILLSAGEMRGESAEVTTLGAFFDGLAADWSERRPGTAFHYYRDAEGEVAMVLDSTLRQSIVNVLDNAYEVSPARIRFTVERESDVLKIETRDEGPGFDAGILEALGRPYQSTKDAPGRGLGLFFAMNALRKLGGRLEAANRPGGGAVVTLLLPLAPLLIEEEEAA